MRRAALLLGALLLGAGCQRPAPHEDAPAISAVVAAPLRAEALRVPRATGPFALDGELDEADWQRAARTGPFVDVRGGEARPFSEARFLWDDVNLYVALYAADDDIEARIKDHDGPVWIDDSFSLSLTPAAQRGTSYRIDISALGVVTDVAEREGKRDSAWESGLRLGVDRDGTLGDKRDEDEEWVIEAAIPLRALGLAPAAGARFELELSRCDTPRAGGSKRRCGSWGSESARAAGRGPLLELGAIGGE